MAPAWVDKMKVTLGLQEEEEQGTQTLLQQLDEVTTLNKTQRAIGFATCVGIGLLFSFLSPMFIVRPVKFAVLFTIGNCLSMGSTMFLVGPFKQISNMFDPKRAVSTVIYLATMVLTLVSALVFHSMLLCMLFIVIQFAALVWYCASYVPFAQQMLLRMVGRGAEAGDAAVTW